MTVKYIKLDAMHFNLRKIFPIARLNVLSSNDIFYFVDYEIVAFKIIENDAIYYKNLSLTEEGFNKIKKVF